MKWIHFPSRKRKTFSVLYYPVRCNTIPSCSFLYSRVRPVAYPVCIERPTFFILEYYTPFQQICMKTPIESESLMVPKLNDTYLETFTTPLSG